MKVPETREYVIVKCLYGGYYIALPSYIDRAPPIIVMAASQIDECFDFIRRALQKEIKDE